jgi:hypothetical protein
MNLPFDIFWFGESGPSWIEAVESMETAKAHIAKLPQANSGSYAVLDQRSGQRVEVAGQARMKVGRKRAGLARYAKAS